MYFKCKVFSLDDIYDKKNCNLWHIILENKCCPMKDYKDFLSYKIGKGVKYPIYKGKYRFVN